MVAGHSPSCRCWGRSASRAALPKQSAPHSRATKTIQVLEQSPSDHAEAIEASDAILGLHCDGAVNEIVRAACERRKSFAIVACCVFPKMFPRTLNDGRPVILRGELNDWILEECARRGYQGTLGRGQLPFEGANEVVYGIAGQRGRESAYRTRETTTNTYVRYDFPPTPTPS